MVKDYSCVLSAWWEKLCYLIFTPWSNTIKLRIDKHPVMFHHFRSQSPRRTRGRRRLLNEAEEADDGDKDDDEEEEEGGSSATSGSDESADDSKLVIDSKKRAKKGRKRMIRFEIQRCLRIVINRYIGFRLGHQFNWPFSLISVSAELNFII